MNQVERIGRFEVQERLRANSFAIVYRGRDPFDGRRVQIQFCVATDETIRHGFLKAAERAAALRHPNIATLFEFGSGDGKPYLVQEAFSEENLSDLLARAEPVEDVLKLYYLVQVARGLQYAHREGVLHRELRPASILLNRSGDAKIADFGTARIASAFAQLGNGAHRWPAVGWLLPELLLGLELDRRSDIYGFGALAFELLTGQAPFVSETLAGLVPQILETDPRPLGVHWPECPPELDRLVLRCLARDPGQRFGSMNELVEELGQIVPVSEPADVFEEEKTVVIEDVQTIYLADLEQQKQRPQEDPAATVSMQSPTAASRDPRRDWQAAGALIRSWGRRSGLALSAGASQAGQVVGKAGSVLKAAGGVGFHRTRLRTTAIVVGALSLFGVVGWSVVRVPDRDLSPLPIAAPALPVATVEPENGLLLIDSQPWGEIIRVLDAEGNEVELPENRYTPLPLELSPGPYRVDISRPDLEMEETCKVVVESEEAVHCELQLAAVETSAFFKEVGWWQ